MIFWHKRKMDNFDPYNVLLAIATNIPVLLMTAFVLQSHVYQQLYECYKTISLLFLLLLLAVSVIYSSHVVWVNPSLHSYYTLTAHLCLFSSSPSTSTCAGVQQKATWIPSSEYICSALWMFMKGHVTSQLSLWSISTLLQHMGLGLSHVCRNEFN